MAHRLVLTGSLALVALVAVACQHGKDTSDEPLTVGGMTETVRIDGFAYAPGNLQVPAGASVTFVNGDAAAHDAEDLDGRWETSKLDEGEEDSVTLAEPGEYEYRCSLHPAMRARIVVVQAPAVRARGD